MGIAILRNKIKMDIVLIPLNDFVIFFLYQTILKLNTDNLHFLEINSINLNYKKVHFSDKNTDIPCGHFFLCSIKPELH